MSGMYRHDVQKAVKNNDTAQITALLINETAIVRTAALHTGLLYGKVLTINTLLTLAPANGVPSLPPPIFSALRARGAEPLRLLLRAGANVNVSLEQETPLHVAAREHTTFMCKMLIDAGARLEARNNYRQTPLQVACRYRNYRTVKLLTACGANVNNVDAFGNPVLFTAICHLTELWCIRDMLVCGADIYPLLEMPYFDTLRAAAGGIYALDVLGIERSHSSSNALALTREYFVAQRWRFVRQRAATLCMTLYMLRFPALVSVLILEHIFVYSDFIRMSCWWDLACAVKHFHDKKNER